jgi:hypothetical protein
VIKAVMFNSSVQVSATEVDPLLFSCNSIRTRSVFTDTTYETTDSWNSEAQNQRKANRRISNKKYRMTKCGIASLSLFLNRQNTSLRYSTFLVRHSIFDFLKFLFRLDWTLAASGSACMKLHFVGTVNRLNIRY